MEHKSISGGEQWLSFSRSCVRKLKGLGLPHAAQAYEVDGASIKVRIEPGHEYIRIDGGKLVWMMVTLVDYPGLRQVPPVEIPNPSDFRDSDALESTWLYKIFPNGGVKLYYSGNTTITLREVISNSNPPGSEPFWFYSSRVITRSNTFGSLTGFIPYGGEAAMWSWTTTSTWTATQEGNGRVVRATTATSSESFELRYKDKAISHDLGSSVSENAYPVDAYALYAGAGGYFDSDGNLLPPWTRYQTWYRERPDFPGEYEAVGLWFTADMVDTTTSSYGDARLATTINGMQSEPALVCRKNLDGDVIPCIGYKLQTTSSAEFKYIPLRGLGYGVEHTDTYGVDPVLSGFVSGDRYTTRQAALYQQGPSYITYSMVTYDRGFNHASVAQDKVTLGKGRYVTPPADSSGTTFTVSGQSKPLVDLMSAHELTADSRFSSWISGLRSPFSTVFEPFGEAWPTTMYPKPLGSTFYSVVYLDEVHHQKGLIKVQFQPDHASWGYWGDELVSPIEPT